MQRIYKNQDVKIVIPVSEDVSDATVKIKARKPDGNVVEYENPSTIEEGMKVSLIMVPDQAGPWHFWVHATWPDSTKTPSNPATIIVHVEGF